MTLPLLYRTPSRGLAMVLACFLVAGCNDNKKDAGVKPQPPIEQPPVVVQPPVEPPPPEQPPEPSMVSISGRVIGPVDASGFTLSQLDSTGNTLATWTTDAQGQYAIEVTASDTYYLQATPVQSDAGVSLRRAVAASGAFAAATPVEKQPLEARCESEEAAFTCNITPWSTLLFTQAQAQNVSTEDIANQLRALNYYQLPVNEDPFILHENGMLSEDDFDTAGVLELLRQPDGLARWLTSMDNWLTAPGEAEIPVSVPRFIVSTQVSGDGTITPSQQEVVRSQQLSLVITPAFGSHIVSVSGCNGTLNQNSYQTGIITANCQVSVQFSQLQYALTYQAEQGGSVQGPASQQVAHGQSGRAVTAVAAAGYQFAGWSDGSLVASRTDSNITANVTFTALFKVNRYTANYSANTGGSIHGLVSQEVAHGSNTTAVTAVPDAGYIFLKWSDGITANPRTDTNITANSSVEAIFEIAQYNLTYSAGNGGSLNGTASQWVAHGLDGAAIHATAHTGYVFTGWSDGVTANPRTDLNIQANKSVEAIFELLQYSLSYTAGAGGSLSGVASQTVAQGNAGSAVQAVANAGYVFVKWSDDVTANPRTDLNIQANKSVEAIFELLQYSLSYTAGAGGSLSGVASQTVAHGNAGSIVKAVPNAGYVFLKWSDDVVENPRTDLSITANKSVQAIFELSQYTLSYTAGEGGTVTGNASQAIAHGNDGSAVTASPNTGYAFVKWSDEVTANPRTDLNIQANKSVEAIFELLQYSLSYTAGAGGSLSGVASQTVAHGDAGSVVEAVPNAGYVFLKWSDDVTANPRTDLNIQANKSVEAIFELLQYNLSYTAGAGGSLSGVASQTVSHGNAGSAVKAVPNAGYAFLKWSDDVVENPRTDLNIASNLSVEAIFELLQYSLSYTAGAGGSLSGVASQTVAHGNAGSAVQAVPNAGYAFLKWSDDVVENPRTDLNIASNLSVEAIFEVLEYSLTYTAGNGGSLTGLAAQTVAHGNDGSAVTAVADTGYTFIKWSDEVVANPRTDLNITTNLAIEAVFEVMQYNLTYTAGSGGSLSGTTSQTVSHGSNGSAVTAVPDQNYVFLKWSDELTANPRSDLNIVATATVEAIFALKTYNVTYSVASGGSISGESSQVVVHGNDASSVTAVAANGFAFEQWSDGSTDNPRTDAAIMENVSIVAMFVRTAVSLNVGEEYSEEINSSGSEQPLKIFNAGGSNAEYLLVPMNLTQDSNLILKVDATNNIAPNNGTAPSSGTSLSPDQTLVTRKNHIAEYKLRSGTTGTGTPVSPVSVIPNGVTPNVGDLWSLNSKLDNLCEVGEATDATVKYSGTNIIVVADNNNPAGGFTDVQYHNLGATVDSFYSTITTTLGTPSDKDGNEKIVIFMTAGVNRLSPPASSVVTMAMYSPRDALTQSECPTSNLGEIIYVLAPDPTGSVNSNVRTVSSVEGGAPPQIAHELAQIVIDSRRLAAGYGFEESWLNEALAAIAQEKVFLLRATLNPLQNIVVTNLTTGPNASVRVAAFNTYINNYFGYYRPWLQAPTRLGAFDYSGNEMASRGLGWAFLRYVGDRYSNSSLVVEGAMYRNLVDSPYTGNTNLENLINDDANNWLRDFLISVYLDDYVMSGLPAVTTGVYSSSSWNYRSIYGALNASYQLREMAIPVDGTTTALSYAKAGGAGYIRIAVAAGETATITLTPTSVANQNASYTLIRLH